MANQDGGSEVEPLRLEHEAAKARLDDQVSELEEFGRNSIRRFRNSVIGIGILFTAASFIRSNQSLSNAPDCVVSSSVWVCIEPWQMFLLSAFLFVMGVVILSVSLGKESRGIQNAVTSYDIAKTRKNEWSESEFLLFRLREYEERIAENEQVIDVLETSLAFAGACTTLGIIGFSLLAYSVITGLDVTIPLVAFMIILLSTHFIVWRSTPEFYRDAERPWFLRWLKSLKNRQD